MGQTLLFMETYLVVREDKRRVGAKKVVKSAVLHVVECGDEKEL